MNRELQTLRHLISQYFDRSELNSLFFDLQLDSEEARDERKSELVRYLIDASIRRGQLQDLLNLCQQQRPQVAWPTITEQDISNELDPSWSTLSTGTIFRNLYSKGASGGGRGGIAGMVLGTFLGIFLVVWFLRAGGTTDLFVLLILGIALVLGGIAGVPLGWVVGLIESNKQNDLRSMLLFGGIGGLVVGLFAGLVLGAVETLFGMLSLIDLVLALLFGLGLGISMALVIWATQVLLPHFYSLATTADPADRQPLEQGSSRRYEVIGRFLAGGVIGALVGVTLGLAYDLIFGQYPFFGVVTSSIGIPPTTTGTVSLLLAGLISGSLFMAIHKALNKQRPLSLVQQENHVKWGILIILGALGLTLVLAGLRPLGHAYLLQRSEKPYMTREYVGRVISNHLPASRVSVTLVLEGVPIETVTDENGIYRFTIAATDASLSGTVFVESRIHGTYVGDITINPDTTILTDIHLSRNVVPELIP
jgi:hypothetical protein